MNAGLSTELIERAREKTLELIKWKAREISSDLAEFEDVKKTLGSIASLVKDIEELDKMADKSDTHQAFPGLTPEFMGNH